MPEDSPLNPKNQSDQIKPEFSIPELDSLGHSKSSKKSNKKIIIVAIVAIFLLIIIGGLAYYYFFYSSSQSSKIESDFQAGDQELMQDEINQVVLSIENVDTSDWVNFRSEEFGIEFKYPIGWQVNVNKYERPQAVSGGITGLSEGATIGEVYGITLEATFDKDPFTKNVEIEIRIKKYQKETYAEGYLESYAQELHDELVAYWGEEFANQEEYQSKLFTTSSGNKVFRPAGSTDILVLNGNTLYEVEGRLYTIESNGFRGRQNSNSNQQTFIKIIEEFVTTISFMNDGRIEGGADVYIPETEEEKLSEQIVGEVNQIQIALELYYNDFDSYPSPPLQANRLGVDAKMLTKDGFLEKSLQGLDSNDVFFGKVPAHPKSPEFDYLYYLCDDGSYIIEFYIKEEWDSLPDGKIYGTPGRQRAAASYEIPESCLSSNSILSSDPIYDIELPPAPVDELGLDDKIIEEVETLAAALFTLYQETSEYPHKYDVPSELTYLLCKEDSFLIGYNLISYQERDNVLSGKYYYYRYQGNDSLSITYNQNFTKEIPEECTDLDEDGLSDYFEDKYGTDINNRDTDGDGFLDGEEVMNGFNPNGEGSL